MLKVMTCILKDSPSASVPVLLVSIKLLVKEPVGSSALSDVLARRGPPAKAERFKGEIGPTRPALNAIMAELPLLRDADRPPLGDWGSLELVRSNRDLMGVGGRLDRFEGLEVSDNAEGRALEVGDGRVGGAAGLCPGFGAAAGLGCRRFGGAVKAGAV
jgi:hypothetical protein